ncbi:MAG: NosD domain-containing protein, partial [Candidatus ainarchaeum sp.]|nr:NosD domain-containing protein [Candidatus ainarchaeum sp.]
GCNLSSNTNASLYLTSIPASTSGLSVSADSMEMSRSETGVLAQDSNGVGISSSKIYDMQPAAPGNPTYFMHMENCKECGISNSRLNQSQYGILASNSDKFYVTDTGMGQLPCGGDPYNYGILAYNSKQGAISNVNISLPVSSPGRCYSILLNKSPETAISHVQLNGSSEGFLAEESGSSSLSSSAVMNVLNISVRILDSPDFNVSSSLVNGGASTRIGIQAIGSPNLHVLDSVVSNDAEKGIELLGSGAEINDSTVNNSGIYGLDATNSRVSLYRCQFADNSRVAVRLNNSGGSLVNGSLLQNHLIGVFAYQSAVSVLGNEFVNNSDYAVHLNLSPGSSVNDNSIVRSDRAIIGDNSGPLDIMRNSIDDVLDGVALRHADGSHIEENMVWNTVDADPPVDFTAIGIYIEESKNLDISKNSVVGKFPDSGIMLNTCNHVNIVSNKIEVPETGLAILNWTAYYLYGLVPGVWTGYAKMGLGLNLVNVSDVVFYDNLFRDSEVFIDVNSTGISATQEGGGENILGCAHQGGNAWLAGGLGFSEVCDDINGDCFCDSEKVIDADLNDTLPLALNQGFDFTVRADAVNGKGLGTRQQFNSKEYVAATTGQSQDITFSILSKINGT